MGLSFLNPLRRKYSQYLEVLSMLTSVFPSSSNVSGLLFMMVAVAMLPPGKQLSTMIPLARAR